MGVALGLISTAAGALPVPRSMEIPAAPLIASVTALLVVAVVTNGFTIEPVASAKPLIVQASALGDPAFEAMQIPGPLPPLPLPPPLPPPPSTAHEFVATQPYRFEPAAALVLKNNCPTLQVAGSAVPVFSGRVEISPLKSTSRLCLGKLICVCPTASPASKPPSKPNVKYFMYTLPRRQA
jgi:hypothetical protein